MKRALASISTLLLLLAAGCSGKKSSSSGACSITHGGTAGPTAQFNADPSCYANPFPNDLLLGSNGRVAIPGKRFDYVLPSTSAYDSARTYLNTVASSLDSDGFSTIAPIWISLDQRVAASSTTAGVKLFVYGTSATPVPDTHALVGTFNDDLGVLEVQPQTPLSPATTYGVVVTALLVDSSGRPTVRSKDFQKLLNGGPSPKIAGLLTAAQNAGITPDLVSVAFTFTTMHETDDLQAISSQVFGPTTLGSSLVLGFTPLGALAEGTFANGSSNFNQAVGAVSSTAMAAVVTGTYDSYDFRNGSGAFDPGFVAGTATPSTNLIDFRLTIPKGTAPAGGWPVVIFQHGLGGSDLDVYPWGELLAIKGFATVAISAVEHGLRGDTISFFKWNDIPATREDFRQTNADQMQLIRALRNSKAKGVSPFDQLDPSDVTYFGISLGGIMGSAFLANTPGNSLGMLNVPGGHLALELYSPKFSVYYWPYIQSYSGLQSTDPKWIPMLEAMEPLAQIGLDSGDPINYGPHVIADPLPGMSAKRVLHQESLNDQFVTNDTNEALRRALGLSMLTAPTSNAGGVSGTWLYTLADFPQVGSADPHSYFGLLCQEQEQAFHWIASGGTDVIDPKTAVCP